MNGTAVFQKLGSLSDATRGRLLNVLDRHELAVSELCAVVQLPQSTVSRHLRVLSDEGWLVARSEGTSRLYRLSSRLDGEAQRLWQVVREALGDLPEAEQDLERARQVVASRRTRSQEFFASAAGEWDSVRAELFGAHPELAALPALLDPGWVVGDLGCGTGQLAATLASFVRRVVAVDESTDMLDAARARLRDVPGVEVRRGRLEALPLEDGELDVAVLSLVLHYLPAPEQALREAARVLAPSGRVLVVDMQAHGREEYRERMGHVWQGFTREQLEGWLEDAGLRPTGWFALPQAPETKGPLLFAAVAVKQ